MARRRPLLIVASDPQLRALLRLHLEQGGFAVREAETGEQALQQAGKQCDLVVLEVRLRGIDGLEVLRRLRAAAATAALPVVLLDAGAAEADKVRGFEVGADDYVTRPVSPRELLARIRAILRRTGGDTTATPREVFELGRLRVDFESYEVHVEGRRLPLSLREFELLGYLLRNPHRVHDRLSLLDAVWGRESFPEPRTIDVHIRRLRKAIERDDAHPEVILTVRGVGYRCNPQALDAGPEPVPSPGATSPHEEGAGPRSFPRRSDRC